MEAETKNVAQLLAPGDLVHLCRGPYTYPQCIAEITSIEEEFFGERRYFGIIVASEERYLTPWGDRGVLHYPLHFCRFVDGDYDILE